MDRSCPSSVGKKAVLVQLVERKALNLTVMERFGAASGAKFRTSTSRWDSGWRPRNGSGNGGTRQGLNGSFPEKSRDTWDIRSAFTYPKRKKTARC